MFCLCYDDFLWGRLATCGRLAIGLPLPSDKAPDERLSFAACRNAWHLDYAFKAAETTLISLAAVPCSAGDLVGRFFFPQATIDKPKNK